MPRPDGWSSKPVGGLSRQIRLDNSERWVTGRKAGKGMTPCCQEKLLGIEPVTVPKPTQVGWYQNTKARERNLVKELGKLTP